MSEPEDKLRIRLVNVIREKGINDEKVLQAIGKVPRHFFVGDIVSIENAYEDEPIDIGQGQTISQPSTTAYQSQILDVKAGEKVLEIGTGSGYQAAVLAELGAEVYTIERQEKLYLTAKERLSRLGYDKIKTFFGDGYLGVEESAPYDKIIVTAASPGIPSHLVEQMKIGGAMVVPVNGRIHKMLRITKISETETIVKQFGDFLFVPMLPGIVKD